MSINTPQPGTDFYKSAQENGWLKVIRDYDDFDGNGHVCVDYPHYPADRIQASFQAALAAFDSGKEKARADSLKNELKQSLASIDPGSHVLTLRSARTWMVSILLDALHDTTGFQTDLLAQDTVLNQFQDHDKVANVYSYGSGFFSPEHFPRELENLLKEVQYDWIVIPMANRHLGGYANALGVAKKLGGQRMMGVIADGTTQELV